MLVFTLCACIPAAPLPITPTQTTSPTLTLIPATQTLASTLTRTPVTKTATPSLTSIPVALTAAPTQPESGLIIEEYELLYDPGFEPFTFAPRTDTQTSILAKYASIKQLPFQHRRGSSDGKQIFYPVVGEDHIIARTLGDTQKEVHGEKINVETVQIVEDEKILFETSMGQVTPITSLRGLWLDGAHWYLEIAYGIEEVDGKVVHGAGVVGRIYQDGVLLNDQMDSTEMFGFQFLGGKPFYFYQKDNRIHIFYDHQDLPLEYDTVSHYLCCSAGDLNPKSGPNWIGFFGRRGKTSYYTEILAP